MHRIKILLHVKPEGLEQAVNEWLQNTDYDTLRSIVVSHDGHFHYATITYIPADWQREERAKRQNISIVGNGNVVHRRY